MCGRKWGIPTCTIPALPWERRGSGTMDALTFQRVSGCCWAKAHLLGVTPAPLAKLKGQSLFHFTWWLPPRPRPPPVGKSIRALIKPHMFLSKSWFSLLLYRYNNHQCRAQTTSVDQQDFMTRRFLYLAKNMPKWIMTNFINTQKPSLLDCPQPEVWGDRVLAALRACDNWSLKIFHWTAEIPIYI